MSGHIHRTKRVDGVKWHWVEAGDGEPVVLLHGIPESWQCWKHQIPTLASQFRVLAFDLKGYGQSDNLVQQGAQESREPLQQLQASS